MKKMQTSILGDLVTDFQVKLHLSWSVLFVLFKRIGLSLWREASLE